MKRSQINKALRELEAMCVKEHCYLPRSAILRPRNGRKKGMNTMKCATACWAGTSRTTALGDFDKVGFSLITIRNGNRKMAG